MSSRSRSSRPTASPNDDLQSGRISQITVAAVQPRRRHWRWLAGAAAALVLIGAGLAGAVWYLRPAPAPPAVEAERVTFEGSAVTPPAISADGKLVVYSALRDGWHNLFVQQLGGGSPDGLSVVYRSERDGGGLFVTDTLGGPGRAERKLAGERLARLRRTRRSSGPVSRKGSPSPGTACSCS